MRFTNKNTASVSFNLVVGLMLVSSIFAGVAFLFPLNFWVEIPTLIIGLFLFYYYKIYQSTLNFLKHQSAFFYFTIGFSVFFASFLPFILDHFGYYIPSILWLQQYGLVQGIANLDILLGQMSFWHIVQAGFSNGIDVFYKINLIVIIAYCWYIFEKKSWVHLLFVPFLYLFVPSPSPDLPAIVFSLIVLNEIMNGNKNFGLLFTISIWVFAIKPTIIWLPLFCFLYGIFILKVRWKSMFWGLFILLIYVLKNMYCFGFPIFPMSIINLNLPWQPNSGIMQLSSQTAIEKTFDMQFTYDQIIKFSRWEAMKNWVFLDGVKSIIHTLFIFVLILFGYYTWRKKGKLIYLLFFSILVKSILVIFFSAQYRFFIEVFIVFGYIQLQAWSSLGRMKIIYYGACLILGIFLSFPKLIQKSLPSFKLSYFMSGIQTKQLLIPENYEYKKYRTYRIGNLNFHISKDYPFNFDTPIPAISPSLLKEDYDVGIIPQLKGKQYKEGFIWRTLTPKEKLELKAILEENTIR